MKSCRSWMRGRSSSGSEQVKKSISGPTSVDTIQDCCRGPRSLAPPTSVEEWRSPSAAGRSSTTRSRPGSRTRGSSWNPRLSRSSLEKAMAGCDYANARVRAMKGRLLGRKGIMELLAQPGLAARLDYLQKTDYGAAVAVHLARE